MGVGSEAFGRSKKLLPQNKKTVMGFGQSRLQKTAEPRAKILNGSQPKFEPKKMGQPQCYEMSKADRLTFMMQKEVSKKILLPQIVDFFIPQLFTTYSMEFSQSTSYTTTLLPTRIERETGPSTADRQESRPFGKPFGSAQILLRRRFGRPDVPWTVEPGPIREAPPAAAPMQIGKDQVLFPNGRSACRRMSAGSIRTPAPARKAA